MTYATLNSLFSVKFGIIVNAAEHAAHFQCPCAHTAQFLLKYLTYSMNSQQRRHSKDSAIWHFFLKSYCFTECFFSLWHVHAFMYLVGLFRVFFHI